MAPFLVMLSSHHLHDLTEVVAAPAICDAAKTIGAVEVGVVIQDQSLALVVSDLFSLPAHRLKRPIGSLADQEDDIRRALDRLFTGF